VMIGKKNYYPLAVNGYKNSYATVVQKQ